VSGAPAKPTPALEAAEQSTVAKPLAKLLAPKHAATNEILILTLLVGYQLRWITE
jgi:hypothetical protein